MNRDQRRRAEREWAADLEAVRRQAGVILEIRYFRAGDLVDVMVAAALGSPEAAAILQAIERTLKHVSDLPPGLPALCGCCDVEVLGTPFLIVLASPEGQLVGKSVGLTATLCTACQSDIPRNALTAFKRVWPEARIVTVHAPPEAVQ